jgi:hypothetical protein
MKENANPAPQTLERLKFRRQFLVGRDLYTPNKYWKAVKLRHDLHLSIHKDLAYFSKEDGEKRVVLIGLAVDCNSPYKEESEITSDLLQQGQNLHSILSATKPLAGRWVVLYENHKITTIFTDPTGLRQVYYYYNGDRCWCASQPALINQVVPLAQSSDESLLEFRKSIITKKREFDWFSNKTAFESCYQLTPNHYLTLHDGLQTRFFPSEPISVSSDADDLVVETAAYLKNIMNGINHKYNAQFALSAGFDSRILLASSHDFSGEAKYFVNDLGNLKAHHEDIYIPMNLSKKLNLNLEIIHGVQDVPDWFIHQISDNISDFRVYPVSPKIKNIYYRYLQKNTGLVLVNGNIIETVRIKEQRIKYDAAVEGKNTDAKANVLLDFTGYEGDFMLNEIKRWMTDIDDVFLIEEASLVDLFYWEQLMGNWGALHPAEQDIACDQIRPFNCRLLLETCLKVPKRKRTAPEYEFFKNIISELWPEVLSEPINPGPKGFGLLKKKLRQSMPDTVFQRLRKLIS